MNQAIISRKIMIVKIAVTVVGTNPIIPDRSLKRFPNHSGTARKIYPIVMAVLTMAEGRSKADVHEPDDGFDDMEELIAW